MRNLIAAILLLMFSAPAHAADLEWIRISDDGKSFVMAESKKPFVPWGFNYDHQEGSGRLIEDYWDDDWATIEEDFGEMKDLGANVIRIHLQFGKFMDATDKPNEHSLDQLDRLVKLAEATGLYLDVTGLGCYHKQDVPDWYDKLDEAARWKAQAVFWEAVASRCAESPAIFCYDLMNEPVVPGNDKRDDWLGGAFGNKHFVQFITLSAAGRPRHEVAKKWIGQLVAAIRKHDERHLVTVGMVPWSLDRPGLTSGFIPKEVAKDLDFVAVHIYPETDKVDEAMETLKGFAEVGKPVVIEEIFPLRCGANELEQFIDQSKEYASGWIGFYWGRTPTEYGFENSIRAAIVTDWLELFQRKGREISQSSLFQTVNCDGFYDNHLQGICTNDKDAIFWSFTTMLVKTDTVGTVLKKIPVANHHGDLCHVNDRIFVAVNLGEFNNPDGKADSWVYEYNADLSLIAKHKTPEVFHGAGGIAHDGKRFVVVGGLPDAIEENYVYEYDESFHFVKKHVIESGHTHLGIQTAEFHDGAWWFGCYGDPKILLKTDGAFSVTGKFEFDCSLGIVGTGNGQFLIGQGSTTSKGRSGNAVMARPDDETGLAVQ